MTLAATLTLQAEHDVREAARRIARDNPTAARDFVIAIRHSARVIGANPGIGTHRPDLTGYDYRFWWLTRYRHVLVYVDYERPPEILRVLHTSQDLPPLLVDLREPS